MAAKRDRNPSNYLERLLKALTNLFGKEDEDALEQKMFHGNMMSAMRRAGNSISHFRFEVNGKMYRAEPLADFYDQRVLAERARIPKEKPEHAKQRQQGLAAFNSGDFQKAARLFDDLVSRTGSRKDWFNVFSARLSLRDLDGALSALKTTYSLEPDTPPEKSLSHPEERFHAARLLSQHQASQAAATELLALAECYSQSIDSTFLYIRRIPSFHQTMDIAIEVRKILGEPDGGRFLKDFRDRVGNEARECIDGVNERA